jgi:hypothetical protein
MHHKNYNWQYIEKQSKCKMKIVGTSYLYGTDGYLLAMYLNTLQVITHIMSKQNLFFPLQLKLNN